MQIFQDPEGYDTLIFHLKFLNDFAQWLPVGSHTRGRCYSMACLPFEIHLIQGFSAYFRLVLRPRQRCRLWIMESPIALFSLFGRWKEGCMGIGLRDAMLPRFQNASGPTTVPTFPGVTDTLGGGREGEVIKTQQSNQPF